MGLIKDNREMLNRFNTFSKFVSLGGVLLSILLLMYIYYRSEIIYDGKYINVYLKYYIISIISVFFWTTILLIKEKLRTNILIMVISTIIGIYIVEISLQLYHDQNVDIKFEDRRTKIEVLEDFFEQGIDAVPAVRPKDVLHLAEEILPLAGVSNTTTVGENETGKWMIYPSDRYGFNNPDYEWDAKKIDYLLTGDSLTEGLAVQPGEEIAGQIRKITGQSVINLGRGGNGPLMELAAISEYAVHLRPKNLIWVYFEGNDLIGNMPRDKKSVKLMKYLDKNHSQNLMGRQREIDQILRRHIEDVRPSKYRWIRLQEIRKLLNFDSKTIEMVVDVDPIFSKILARAKEMTDSWGGQLYFVYLPEFSRYIGNTRVEHEKYRKRSEVIELVKNLNIPIIDIHQEVFFKHKDVLSLFPFRRHGHYNAKGYSEIAKAIVNSVENH